MNTITSGSEKQNAWATDIRDAWLAKCDAIIERQQPGSERQQRAQAMRDFVASVDDARLLIDTRRHFSYLRDAGVRRGWITREASLDFYSLTQYGF